MISAMNAREMTRNAILAKEEVVLDILFDRIHEKINYAAELGENTATILIKSDIEKSLVPRAISVLKNLDYAAKFEEGPNNPEDLMDYETKGYLKIVW